MNFIKQNFHFDGEYLVYGPAMYSKDSRFVARFKRNKRDRSSFTKFLMQNFTVEDYFSAREAGDTPVGILRTRGWVSPTIQKFRDAGLLPSL